MGVFDKILGKDDIEATTEDEFYTMDVAEAYKDNKSLFWKSTNSRSFKKEKHCCC